MSPSNKKEVHTTLRTTTLPTTIINTKQEKEKKPPPQSLRSALELLELTRISLCITKARSQNGNAGTETLIEAAEKHAKADGVLDAYALEKMRDKLRKGGRHRHSSTFWTQEVDKLEAVAARRVRDVEQAKADQSRVLNGTV